MYLSHPCAERFHTRRFSRTFPTTALAESILRSVLGFFGIQQTSLEKGLGLRGGGGEELLYFCNEGKGEEEGDPLEEKLTAESSPFPNSLQ